MPKKKSTLPPVSDEDKALFREAMKKPLDPAGKTGKKSSGKAITKMDLPPIYLSDHVGDPVSPEEKLSYRSSVLSSHDFARLKKKHWPFEDWVDLHGYTLDEARDVLVDFLKASILAGLKVILIIHGKGHGAKNPENTLKNKVNVWLRQIAFVLGFCSAKGEDGGRGAVYVLLKKWV